MAEVGSYWFTLKSEEQRGAGQSNSIHIGLASDADALLFAQNLELAFDADVVSIDKVVQVNYAVPYPAGTDNTFRLVARGPNYETDTEYISDVLDATTDEALAAAITAGVSVGLFDNLLTPNRTVYDSVTATHFPSSAFR